MCHCERPLERVAIDRTGIPRRLIATLAPLARNDPPPAPLRKGGGNGGAVLTALMILCVRLKSHLHFLFPMRWAHMIPSPLRRGLGVCCHYVMLRR